MCGNQVAYSQNIQGNFWSITWFLMAKIITEKGNIAWFSCCVFKRKLFRPSSIQLECSWHLYGIFRECLQLSYLVKLQHISGPHSELCPDLQRWSLAGAPGANRNAVPATQGAAKSSNEEWKELLDSHPEGIAGLAFPAPHSCVLPIALLGLLQLCPFSGMLHSSGSQQSTRPYVHSLNGLSLVSNQASLKKQSEFNSSFFLFFFFLIIFKFYFNGSWYAEQHKEYHVRNSDW